MASKKKEDRWPVGPVICLPAPYEDVRGVIQTLVDGGIHSIQIITSKAGTVRANHYHKNDSHHMYVIKGAMRYFHRIVGDVSPPSWVYVKEGQMVFTPPMMEHAVEFIEDSVFLNITGQARDQGTYENDIVRVDLHKPFVNRNS
jgi:oxalate decarboxylase/phosphoglucose isomerase-like protein (cupin superfamily)